MNSSKGALLILSSILISSVLTYLVTKARYEKRPIPLQSEKKEEEKEQKTEKEETNTQDKDQDVMAYAQKYKQKAESLVRDYRSGSEERPKIQIIDADIFDSDPEYTSVTYTLYSDGILTDEDNEVVTDYDNCVGKSTIERFNELENEGAVYIRNHEYALDIEILRDLRKYKESLGGHANGRS